MQPKDSAVVAMPEMSMVEEGMFSSLEIGS